MLSERDRVAARYAGYAASEAKQRAWSAHNAGNQMIRAELVEAIAAAVDWPPRGPVLDAGCGTGWWLRTVAGAGTPAGRLWGVDVLEDRVAAAAAAVPQAHVAPGDVRALPFPDGSFAFVTLLSVLTSLHSEEDMVRALREAGRVLAPGGVLLVWDLRVPRLRSTPRRVSRGTLEAALGPWERRPITVLPPLARRLGRHTASLYPRLSRMPLARTHFLAVHRA